MEKHDYSEYERRRAENHEENYRLAAALVSLTVGLCRRRGCRRGNICRGPMLPSPHQQGAVRAQKMIGLSGTACASLPSCVAHVDDDRIADLRRAASSLDELRQRFLNDEGLHPRLCARIILTAQKRAICDLRHNHACQSSPLTSPPQRPTSGNDAKE